MEEYEQHMIKNSKISIKRHNEELQRMKQPGAKVLSAESTGEASITQPARPLASLTGHHPNPTVAAGNSQDRGPIFLSSPPAHGLTLPNEQELNASILLQGDINNNNSANARNFTSGNSADLHIFEALEALREGVPSQSDLLCLQRFASQNVTAAPQNVLGGGSSVSFEASSCAGLTNTATNQDYSAYLQRQLQLQELQAISRLRAQQQEAIPNLFGTRISSSNLINKSSTNNLDPRQIAFWQNNNNNSNNNDPFAQLMQHQAAATPISDISGTSSSSTTAALSIADKLQLLRAQAVAEEQQRLRTGVLLRQQQQRNETLERFLLMGGMVGDNNHHVGLPPATGDLADSNGSSSNQQQQGDSRR